MFERRILISPYSETKLEQMKTTDRDGQVLETTLEYEAQRISLGDYSYDVFVGSTAGRKGFPNQDFAGICKKKLSLGGTEYDSLLLAVADGVSSRELSEETSKSIIQNTINKFEKDDTSYTSTKVLANNLWTWIADGAQRSPALQGVSTVSVFLFLAIGKETQGIAINCGDSRVYWATPKYVETAKVHVEVLNPRNAISYALGAGRINKEVEHDIYLIDNPVEIFLCTDTFAYAFDGVHVPEEMIPALGRAISSLKDHLTAISVKRV